MVVFKRSREESPPLPPAPPLRRMKSIHRESVTDEFQVTADCPVPAVPKGGARVKVHYAGACYTDMQMKKSGTTRLRTPGVQDTSLFEGFEVSGVVDDVCNTIEDSDVRVGDRVIVYPDANVEKCTEEGSYAEYIVVKNMNNLIRVPESLQLEVASLLPCSALRAYAAVMRAKPWVTQLLERRPERTSNILIVGAGGLGLWTLTMARHFITPDVNKTHITVADTNIEKLMIAKDHGCFDVIHWNESIHEGYILERTRDVCQGGVDVVIDFVSSPRTISRAMKVLNEEGLLLVGGSSQREVPLCMSNMARRSLSVLGVHHGTKDQLQSLVNVFSEGNIKPPLYKVFPVEQANQVFDLLSSCSLNGRAILQMAPETQDDNDSDSAFLPSSSENAA